MARLEYAGAARGVESTSWVNYVKEHRWGRDMSVLRWNFGNRIDVILKTLSEVLKLEMQVAWRYIKVKVDVLNLDDRYNGNDDREYHFYINGNSSMSQSYFWKKFDTQLLDNSKLQFRKYLQENMQ